MSSSNVYSPNTDISFNNNEVFNTNPLVNLPTIKPILPFWGEDPNILFQSLDFFPVDSMTYNQNLNAISRLVILITIIGFILTRNFRLIIIGGITLAAIYILYCIQEKNNKPRKQENFKDATTELLKHNPPSFQKTFEEPSSTNPFSNVLIPDYEYNPDKKPAPPSFEMNTNETILKQAKQTVIDLNPGQPDIADKLFRDLGEQYIFEQSLRPFYSTASTTIPNDQTAFAEFCYGSMISCKEGNPFACARNLNRYTNV
jgi:hypothetical protein